ncbi:hypothetical protein Micbo1qcDRAFT_167614 [Microdochium bolleyi]|uniref:Zn(2)-C6 fungal-type domain-containing protein n=1 Tax=Microdochium bolleyi TaxID=196109 RepID=A0A136IRC6_9PEZI|nr:hypothetical protein Micbo1qcDRAFT_167614 [Microdochium bolleyi]
MPQAQQPRVRAFARRTRAGCVTCKIRRKKCDEARPICNRCRAGGFVCDGYEADGALAPSARSTTPSSDGRASVTPSPRALHPGNMLEAQYYTWFFTDTVAHLELSDAFGPAFWHRLLRPASQQNPFVWHAIVALGATHWQFSRHDPLLLPAGDSKMMATTASSSSFALQHYNDAIAGLLRAQNSVSAVTPAPTSIDMDQVLICCFLFVLLESLRGNYSEALRHLEAGVCIIVDSKEAPQIECPNDGSARKTPFLPNREGHSHDLTALFHAVSCDVGGLADRRPFPSLAHLQMPYWAARRRQQRQQAQVHEITTDAGGAASRSRCSSSNGSPSSNHSPGSDGNSSNGSPNTTTTATTITTTYRFRDLAEAAQVMHEFDCALDDLAEDPHQDWDDPSSLCNLRWDVLQQEVLEWREQFAELMNRLGYDSDLDPSIPQYQVDAATEDKIINLRIQDKMWDLVFDRGDASRPTGVVTECPFDNWPAPRDLTPPECAEMLARVERLWRGRGGGNSNTRGSGSGSSTPGGGGSKRSPFGLSMDNLIGTYCLYVHCGDDAVRARVISMLRAQRRRELIWDSAAMADFLERDLKKRLAGQQEARWPELGPSANEDALVVFRPRRRMGSGFTPWL